MRPFTRFRLASLRDRSLFAGMLLDQTLRRLLTVLSASPRLPGFYIGRLAGALSGPTKLILICAPIRGGTAKRLMV